LINLVFIIRVWT